MSFKRTTRGTALVAALALTLASCGGDDDEPAADPDVEEPADDELEDDGVEEPEADETEDAEAAGIEGCEVEDLPLTEPGQLTVGTGDPVFPPWMLNDDPEGGEGFENGIVYALADELGFEADDVVWVGQTFDEAIAPGPKPYDFAIQQISVTEDRQEIVDFSMVYYQPDKALITLPDSAVADATSFEELQDANWGATIGTTDLDYIEGIIGVPEGEVAVFDDQAGTFQALTAGQIDATVAAFPTALFATDVQVPEAQISALLPADPEDTGHGLLFQQGNDLVDCVDQGLEVIIADGVIDDLIDEYLVGDADVTEISE
jgi:polar amino acid transport system substrate-binding protein